MKRGFTLAELLGVLVLLGIVALITIPILSDTFGTSTKHLGEEQIKSIEEAARIWAVRNSSELSETTDKYITIEELKRSGVIENKDILSVDDQNELKGCVRIYYENNKYNYSYNTYDTVENCH